MFSLEGMSSCLRVLLRLCYLQLRLPRTIIKVKEINESELKLLFF